MISVPITSRTILYGSLYDEHREKRMADRDQKIKEEKSEVKKVLLQARQFLDEFT